MALPSLGTILEKEHLPPDLLLGNGFSISFNQGFSYDSLEELVRDNLRPRTSQLLDALPTNDLEQLMEHLTIVESNGVEDEEAWIEEWTSKAELRNIVVNALMGVHPISAHTVDDARLDSAIGFLAKFRHIFTTNYDLLLYWIHARDAKSEAPILGRNDGFSQKESDEIFLFNPKSIGNCGCFYLHGGFHLRDVKGQVAKRVWKNEALQIQHPAIMEQTWGDFYNGLPPKLIFEGTAAEKHEVVSKCEYLSHGRRILGNSTRPLVTFGFSFSRNDRHLLINFVKTTKSKIYVGLYNEDIVTKANAESWFENLNNIRQKRFNRNPIHLEFFETSAEKPFARDDSTEAEINPLP